jgi:hypothetical protein
MIRTVRGFEVMVEILQEGKITMLNQYLCKVYIVDLESKCFKGFECVGP